MFTVAAIFLGILVLCALYVVSFCLVKTEPAHMTVLAWLGAKPVKLLDTGWNFFFWPFFQVYDVVDCSQVTSNHSGFIMSCITPTPDTPKRNDDNPTPPEGTQSFTTIKANEVSFTYRPAFDLDCVDREALLNNWYSLVKPAKDGKRDDSSLRERIKDILEDCFRHAIRELSLFDALNLDAPTVRRINQAIQKEIEQDADRIPVKFMDLKVNAPFEPTEDSVKKAVKMRGETALVMQAEIVEAERKKRIAEIEIDTATAKATAEAQNTLITTKARAKAESNMIIVTASSLAKAYGLDQLTARERADAFIRLKGLQGLEKLGEHGNSTFIIGSDILSAVDQILGKFTK